MKKTIGPYLCRIETPYLMRRELSRSRRELEDTRHERNRVLDTMERMALELERLRKKTTEPPRAAAAGHARTDPPVPTTLEGAKAHFYAKIRAHYAGEPVPGAVAEQELYRLLQTAADLGDMEAQYILGECSLHGWCTMQVNANAVQWLRRAAQRGHNEAGYRLGLCLIEGKGVAKDEKAGRRWIEQAAASGLAAAKHWLRDHPEPKPGFFSGIKPNGWK